MKPVIQRWEFIGVILIFFAGSVLHFLFEWFNQWIPIALLAAVT